MSSHAFSVQQIHCIIIVIYNCVIYRESTQIVCETGEVEDQLVNKTVTVKVFFHNLYQITAPELFTFKPNPEISDVRPLSSIVE